MFGGIYKGKKVLVTGNTGFKGSWLSAWLQHLGAKVWGFSLDVPTKPANFEVLDLEKLIRHIEGDVRNRQAVMQVVSQIKPDMVFHLAAQALVRKSFDVPAETFETNAFGTMNILEALRHDPKVKVGVFITSDKCYRNLEWPWGYREDDVLGGEDPYSTSKGCAELIIRSYHHSFFMNGPNVASTRAGNVIGGGDWAEDRIVPDAVRAWSQEHTLKVRSPNATRPWQHVLEPLSGYLWLGARLWAGDREARGQAYNFGPNPLVNQSVSELLSALAGHWPGAKWKTEETIGEKKESTLLKLCCDKALHQLGWHAALDFEATVAMTARWYRNYYHKDGADMMDLTRRQIDDYTRIAAEQGLPWTE
jgi:CDP-glucose 4,6-dehydratase